MPTKPTTVKQYLAALPKDRRDALGAIREVVLANLDPSFEEGIQYGMIGYYAPHSVYPAGYHCDTAQPLPFMSLASQKNHIGLYLFCIYCDEGEKDRFVAAWAKSGKKLDMGKSCVRVKNLEGVPLDVLGKTIKRITAKKFIRAYEGALSPAGRAAAKKKAATKNAGKNAGKTAGKTAAKKTASKKTAKKTTKKTAKKTVKKKASG